VGTFLALPPAQDIERAAETVVGRIYGAIRFRRQKTRKVGPSAPVAAAGVLAQLIRQLPDAPVAAWFSGLVGHGFSSPALSRRTKLLVLAVVARTLGSRFCEEEARRELQECGLDGQGFSRILDTLSGPDLTPVEGRILDWARETVRYEPGMIQKRTRLLAAEVGDAALLEAVTAAGVSNMAVRLAMLIE
jgi:alkylhydroperoxidase family enzyme